MTTYSDFLAAQREREEEIENAQEFIHDLEHRSMSTWTNEEMALYNFLTDQEQ